MWVTHQARVMVRYYEVYVCAWPYLLEKSINDLQNTPWLSLLRL